MDVAVGEFGPRTQAGQGVLGLGDGHGPVEHGAEQAGHADHVEGLRPQPEAADAACREVGGTEWLTLEQEVYPDGKSPMECTALSLAALTKSL